MDPALQRLVDKQAITETLMRYCRGVDRLDRALLESVYWPDALDDHVTYVGDRDGFIEYVFAVLKDMQTSHMLANILIELAGDAQAHSETYYLVYHEMPTPLGGQEFVVGGRFLDTFEKRDGDWRILKRTMVVDYYTVAASTSAWASGPFSQLKHRGRHYPDDPIYRVS